MIFKIHFYGQSRLVKAIETLFISYFSRLNNYILESYFKKILHGRLDFGQRLFITAYVRIERLER